MKPWHFKIFHKLLDEAQPQTIGEIGTHNGRTGVQMCEYMLKNYEHKVVGMMHGNLSLQKRASLKKSTVKAYQKTKAQQDVF